MNREQKQTAFQIHPSDNVATALGALEAGRVTITGEACAPEILAAYQRCVDADFQFIKLR